VFLDFRLRGNDGFVVVSDAINCFGMGAGNIYAPADQIANPSPVPVPAGVLYPG